VASIVKLGPRAAVRKPLRVGELKRLAASPGPDSDEPINFFTCYAAFSPGF
jgi:hypothetical protein